jgi:hypothetical protein
MSWIEYTSFQNYPSKHLKAINWECDVNQKIINNDNINTAWKRRTYMQNNTKTIINYNTKNSISHLGNNNNNILNITDRGFSYDTMVYSDLKQNYLKKETKITCPSILMN